MSGVLYDHLGGRAGIDTLVDRIIDLHLDNPTVATRFERTDLDRARALVKEFFAMGSGGPAAYTGRSMVEAHAGMNISEQEFLAVVDDIMQAMTELGHDEATRSQVLTIAYSLKGEIIRR